LWTKVEVAKNSFHRSLHLICSYLLKREIKPKLVTLAPFFEEGDGMRCMIVVPARTWVSEVQ